MFALKIFRIWLCMSHVTSIVTVLVSYSIVVNGEIIDPFFWKRTLSRRFSFLLFLLCIEGFSALLIKYHRNGQIKGAQASRYEPRVNHIFFADDNLLFARSNRSECEKVMRTLQQYKESSGQKNKFHKSAFVCEQML